MSDQTPIDAEAARDKVEAASDLSPSIYMRRFGPEYAKKCRDISVVECAMSDCQYANECQHGELGSIASEPRLEEKYGMSKPSGVVATEDYMALKADRDALLEALEFVVRYGDLIQECKDKARAAIQRVKQP